MPAARFRSILILGLLLASAGYLGATSESLMTGSSTAALPLDAPSDESVPADEVTAYTANTPPVAAEVATKDHKVLSLLLDKTDVLIRFPPANRTNQTLTIQLDDLEEKAPTHDWYIGHYRRGTVWQATFEERLGTVAGYGRVGLHTHTVDTPWTERMFGPAIEPIITGWQNSAQVQIPKLLNDETFFILVAFQQLSGRVTITLDGPSDQHPIEPWYDAITYDPLYHDTIRTADPHKWPGEVFIGAGGVSTTIGNLTFEFKHDYRAAGVFALRQYGRIQASDSSGDGCSATGHPIYVGRDLPRGPWTVSVALTSEPRVLPYTVIQVWDLPLDPPNPDPPSQHVCFDI